MLGCRFQLHFLASPMIRMLRDDTLFVSLGGPWLKSFGLKFNLHYFKLMMEFEAVAVSLIGKNSYRDIREMVISVLIFILLHATMFHYFNESYRNSL